MEFVFQLTSQYCGFWLMIALCGWLTEPSKYHLHKTRIRLYFVFVFAYFSSPFFGSLIFCVLRKHERLHNGIRRHCCQECHKAFTTKSSLHCHMTVHSGLKPYACEICTKSFAQKGTLQRHIKSVHEQNKDYACSLCGTEFGTKGYLITLLWVHTGEKPFKCTKCSTAFAHLSTLRKHKAIHISK